MRQPGVLRRIAGWLAGSIATILILLAAIVGVARLLLPLAPDYQDEIRRFASEATGFDVRFGQITATWPVLGPEIRFSDVRIATLKDRRPVLDAGELSVGLNLWQLVAERRLRPGRIAVSDASVKAERLANGRWLVNGVPLDELVQRPANQPLPRLDLRLQNIALLAVDPSRLEPRVKLRIEQLDLDLGPIQVVFDGELEGDEGFGTGIGLAGTLPASIFRRPVADGTPAVAAIADDFAWDVRLTGGDIDVARWLRVAANEPVPMVSGRGKVEVQAEFSGLAPRSLTVDLALGPTAWRDLATTEDNYQRLELQANWQRIAGGWEARLERFAVERGATALPASSGALKFVGTPGGSATVSAVASNLRLQDFWPVLWSVASENARQDLLPARLQGTVRDLKLTASLPKDAAPTYVADATFRGLGVTMPEPGWAVTGITGRVRADQEGGRLTLDSGNGLVRLPSYFRADIRTTTATGQLGWKYTRRGVELVADELQIATADATSNSRVHLLFPREGSVFVDIAARFTASSAPAAVNYLPLKRFKPNVVKWLDQAIVAGSVPRAELLWQGPVRGLPYEAGDGRFRAEVNLADAVINYSPEWPRLQNASGSVIFDKVSLTSVQNKGTIGGVPFEDLEIRVANLVRDAELDVAATDTVQLAQLLNFLRESPVADLLGPTLATVTGSGNVVTGINLQLPLARPKDYRLAGSFKLERARLGLKGVDFGLTELQGTVNLRSNRLVTEQLSARFLDEPVNIELRAARLDEPELTQVAEVRSSTPTQKLAAAFSLPYGEQLDGNLVWAATVQVPTRGSGRPLSIGVSSDMEELVSHLPAPLTKAAGVRERLTMDVALPERGVVFVDGQTDRRVSWALQFLAGKKASAGAATARPAGTGWRLERGSLRSGRTLARLPAEPGLEIGGRFSTLRFEDWYTGGGDGANGGEGLIRKIDFEASRFAIFGRLFRDLKVAGERSDSGWQLTVNGPSATGTVSVPPGGKDDAPIVLDMQRLWLLEPDEVAGNRAADPRRLPAVRAAIADFAFKDMRLGRLEAELAQRGDGVVIEPLRIESATFSITGNLTWVVENDDVARQRTEARLRLSSTNFASTLRALGYGPVVEGEKATVTAELFWPGGPGEDFLNAAGGRVVVNLAKGQFLPVDPGGGRLVGLLSIAKLPRRLGLDFSDVVDKGLAFDRVRGEFRLEDGNAFTCNFGLEGPVTDIGIVGRVSFRDRSYDQLAVVRPHVSDMLAVGSFVGGPVVGGAVLLISQIFRKPLSSLGESYYRVAGNWDQPAIDKVEKNDVDVTPFKDCERYLAEVLNELPPEAELSP